MVFFGVSKSDNTPINCIVFSEPKRSIWRKFSARVWPLGYVVFSLLINTLEPVAAGSRRVVLELLGVGVGIRVV